MRQVKYLDCINYGCQTNWDKSIYIIKKLRKSAGKLEFEDECQIELIMELGRQVNKIRDLIE